MQGDSSAPGPRNRRAQPRGTGGRQSEAMQGDSSTPGPRNNRTEPTRDRGTAERSDAGGFPGTRTSQSSSLAGSHSRARRLAHPPGSLRSPVPPKGRTKPNSNSSPSSPFQGGRQERSDDAGGFLGTRTLQSSDGANEGQGDGRGAQRRCRGIPRHRDLAVVEPSREGKGDGRAKRCRGIPRHSEP